MAFVMAEEDALEVVVVVVVVVVVLRLAICPAHLAANLRLSFLNGTE